jgi:hypothetical protein
MSTSWKLEAIPQDRHDRWRWLDEFLHRWRRSRVPTDGLAAADIARAEARLGRHLPEAVREFYALLGAANDLVRTHNDLLSIDKVMVEDGRLLVWAENQSVATWWLVLDHGDPADPPVDIDISRMRRDASGRTWVREDRRFSEMATRMLLHETVLMAPFSANGGLPGDVAKILEVVANELQELPFSPWFWPSENSRIFGKGEVLVELDGVDWIWLAAVDQPSFDRVRRLVERAGVKWEGWFPADVIA